MPKSVWACLALLLFVGAFSSSAVAVERGLAGVRLGVNCLDLLDSPGFGEPLFIGPLGAVSIAGGQAQVGARSTGAAGGVQARSGPSGPSGAGARGGRAGARGGRAGARGGGAGARGGMGGGRAGMGGRGGGAGAVGAGQTRTTGRGTAAEGGMFWYYRPVQGQDIVLVLSLDTQGDVRVITLSGRVPYAGSRTTRGIGLTSGYMETIAKYGYPDASVTSGTIQELTYVDHGVRFTLDSMRVVRITIGSHIGAALVAPEVGPEAAPPPAGMSIEELRGYL